MATSGPSKSGPPVNKPPVKQASRNSILVNKRQEGNPVLELVRNVPWEYAAISSDYQLGASTCALFLSLRYFRLHPEYLHRRVQDLGTAWKLRIILFHIDAKDPENEIKELTKYCIINNLTIMAVWTLEEAALYITTYKAYENKSPDMIKERIDKDYASILRSALTSIKGVNKTDVTTLRANFGDFATMSQASFEDLNLCPGFGKVKARRVKDAFEKPFYNGQKDATQSVTSKDQGKEAESALNDGSASLDSRMLSKGRRDEGETEDIEEPLDPGSPDWDIDLDLNPNSDQEDLGSSSKSPARKKARTIPSPAQ